MNKEILELYIDYKENNQNHDKLISKLMFYFMEYLHYKSYFDKSESYKKEYYLNNKEKIKERAKNHYKQKKTT